jgi:hypothetical protein
MRVKMNASDLGTVIVASSQEAAAAVTAAFQNIELFGLSVAMIVVARSRSHSAKRSHALLRFVQKSILAWIPGAISCHWPSLAYVKVKPGVSLSACSKTLRFISGGGASGWREPTARMRASSDFLIRVLHCGQPADRCAAKRSRSSPSKVPRA